MLIRNLLRVVDNPVVGLIVLVNIRTFQRIGDLLAGTLVANVPGGFADNEKEQASAAAAGLHRVD